MLVMDVRSAEFTKYVGCAGHAAHQLTNELVSAGRQTGDIEPVRRGSDPRIGYRSCLGNTVALASQAT